MATQKNHRSSAAEVRTKRPQPVRNPLPQIIFLEELSVNSKRRDIESALRDHQVVIVCGETGSGKTTQLPKIWPLPK